MSIIGQLLKDSIQPILRPMGFKKKGYVFNRQYEDCIQVIDFQVSRKGDTAAEDVTINIGIFMPDVWQFCWGKPVPDFVKEHECFPRFRIGFLLSGFDKRCLDKWWRLSDAQSDDSLAEITAAVEQVCVPFLDSHGKRSSIVDFIKTKANLLMPIDFIQSAILDWLNNDKTTALSILAKYQKNSHWEKRASEVRKRLEEL